MLHTSNFNQLSISAQTYFVLGSTVSQFKTNFKKLKIKNFLKKTSENLGTKIGVVQYDLLPDSLLHNMEYGMQMIQTQKLTPQTWHCTCIL